MRNRRYLLWLVVLAGVLLLGGQALSAPLPYQPRGDGRDRPTDGPGEDDGDADDLMIYIQPHVPDIDVVQVGDREPEPVENRQGSRESKFEWLRDALLNWLSRLSVSFLGR